MSKIIFQARIGLVQHVKIVMVFVLFFLGYMLLFQGQYMMETAGALAALYGVIMLMLWWILNLSGKKRVATVALEPGRLGLEMIHAFGQGEKLTIPIDQVSSWTWQARYRQRSTPHTVVTLSFEAQGRVFDLRLTGARSVSLDDFRAIAPVAMAELQRNGHLIDLER